MKIAKILTILVLARALMLCPVSTALGAVSLTVNGQDVTLIELEQGRSCTVEVVSDDGISYVAYLGFDDCVVLGDFSHLETRPEAGNLATAIEYDQPAFYGYYLSASGFSPPPSAGVHFTFEYVALQLGETDLKLYDETFTSVIDSVNITVTPLQPVAMGSAFTYQGRLSDTEGPAEGLYDFRFKLYDNPDLVFAAQQGAAIDVNDLDVVDGYFTVELDFGADVFNGDARWLQIDVRPSEFEDTSEYTALSPRQELTPAPYAMYARTARAARSLDAADGSPTDALYVDDAGNIGIGTTTPGAKLDVEAASGPAATIGSSYNSAAGDYAVAMGDGTTAGGDGSTAMGVYTTAGGYASTVMGYYTTADGFASTAMGRQTTADGYASTAMGEYTTAGGDYSTAMGNDTTAGGSFSIAMGYGTTAGGFCSTAMGYNTTAGGVASTAMGYGTIAGGPYSTAMGAATTAIGDYSTAMGRDIEAAGDYSVAIALADMDGATVTQDNTMAILGGNVGIGTPSPTEKLAVSLGSGSGDIASFSALENNRFMISIDGADTSLAAQAGNNLKLGTSFSGTSMTILNSNGNVGIGKTSPVAKLHIGGTPGVDGIMYPDNTLQTTAGGGSASVPIGAVIEWWRPNDTFDVPEGYKICDGTVISDALSPFNGQTLPDLRNKFVRGAATVNDIGQTGGANTHTHTISGATESTVVTMGTSTEELPVVFPGTAIMAKSNHKHSTYPHSHGSGTLATSSVSHLPPYVGLLKIMRIR